MCLRLFRFIYTFLFGIEFFWDSTGCSFLRFEISPRGSSCLTPHVLDCRTYWPFVVYILAYLWTASLIYPFRYGQGGGKGRWDDVKPFGKIMPWRRLLLMICHDPLTEVLVKSVKFWQIDIFYDQEPFIIVLGSLLCTHLLFEQLFTIHTHYLATPCGNVSAWGYFISPFLSSAKLE
jgi:hypothetical protein